MMDVSVILPVFNGGEKFQATLASVLGQEKVELECIVVDDGEKPGIRFREATARDRRTRVVTHSENLGVAAARNSGLEAACGDYAFFVDPGDTVETGALAELLSAARSSGGDLTLGSLRLDIQSDLTRMGTGQTDLFPDGALPLEAPAGEYGRERFPSLLESLLKNDLLHPVTGKLYRREALKSVRFDETVFCQLEDELFNVTLFQSMRKVTVIDKLALYLHDSGLDALSNRYDGDRLLNLRKLWHEYGVLLSMLNITDDSSLKKEIQRQFMLQYVSLLANWRREAEFVDSPIMFFTARELLEAEPFRQAAKDLGLEEERVVSTLNVLVDIVVPKIRRHSFVVEESTADYVQCLTAALEMVRSACPPEAERYAALARKSGDGEAGVGLVPDSLWRAEDD